MSTEDPQEPMNPEADPLAGGPEDDVPFEDFEAGGGQSLKELIDTNPMVKVGLIGGVIVVLIVGVMLFSGKKTPGPMSVIAGGKSTVNDTPGSDQVSAKYREAVQEENQTRVEQALKTGGSALPVPVAPPVGRVPITDTNKGQEDPLERWRRIQEERQRAEEQQRGNLQQGNPNAEAIKDLANAMSAQMSTIVSGFKPMEPKHVDITKLEFLNKKNPNGGANGQGAGAGGADTSTAATAAQQPIEILVPAGTVNYAQLLTEANSDIKGPVLAQLVSGPLAGSRILGTLQASDGEGDDYITLTFDTVVIDGIGHTLSGIAINPETDTTALATDVDHRYFKRIILPAASAFITGLGSAIANPGSSTSQSTTSTTTSSPKLDVKQQFAAGIAVASTKVSAVLDQQGQSTKPLVRVPVGTPIGVLFMQPVTDETK